MKKILIAFCLCVVWIAPIFAVKTSLGASADLGLSIIRGDHIDDIYDQTALFSDTGNSDDIAVDLFSFSVKFDTLIELNNYVGIETGAGYKKSKRTYEFRYSDAVENIAFLRNEIVIPIMARFQVPYAGDSKLFYFSVGPKIGIPLSPYYYTYKVEGLRNGKAVASNAPVNLDIGFSLGNDFRVSRLAYWGFRVNYDLNVLKPHNLGEGNFLSNTRHDVLTASLSFRRII